MPFHKQGAYDGFDSVAEAKAHYKRVRTTKHFILSDVGVKLAQPICARCGAPIAGPPKGEDPSPGYTGNRAQYSPRTKKVAVMHYLCAWGNLMGRVCGVEALI